MNPCAEVVGLAGRHEVALRRPGREPGDAATSAVPVRCEALAALDALDAELLRHDSATLALERWCRARGGVPDARIAAQLLERRGDDAAPAAGPRRRPHAGPAEAVRYRRVRLRCGTRVLSEAENWYAPGRLTPEMNQLLDSTDIPFGRVVRELRFRRRLLAITRLWRPAACGGPRADVAAAATVPRHVLRHHALLVAADGVPFGEVVETYTRDALFLPEFRA